MQCVFVRTVYVINYVLRTELLLAPTDPETELPHCFPGHDMPQITRPRDNNGCTLRHSSTFTDGHRSAQNRK